MREPIHVVFVNQVGATAGGAERTLETFLRAIPNDIRVTSLLFEDGRFADSLRALGVAVDIVATPARVATATRERGSLRAALGVPSMVLKVADRLRALRPTLVYTNSMKAHVIGSLAARLTRTPCVIHFHDLFEGAALRTLQTVARVGSSERIACSHLVDSVMDVGKTTVIYGPVQLSAYRGLDDRGTARKKLGIDDDLPVVGLIGRINRWKGHDRFVRIAALVNDEMPVRFAIVGAPVFRDADFVPELEALVASLDLQERVSFYPWVEDVRGVYAALDINANCSTREPFGRTTVEAAAAGVPTVCFSDSGASETIDDGISGRTLPPGDEVAFAAAILSLVRNRPQLKAMSREAQHRAERFDAPVIAEQMATVIRRASSHPATTH